MCHHGSISYRWPLTPLRNSNTPGSRGPWHAMPPMPVLGVLHPWADQACHGSLRPARDVRCRLPHLWASGRQLAWLRVCNNAALYLCHPVLAEPISCHRPLSTPDMLVVSTRTTPETVARFPHMCVNCIQQGEKLHISVIDPVKAMIAQDGVMLMLMFSWCFHAVNSCICWLLEQDEVHYHQDLIGPFK